LSGRTPQEAVNTFLTPLKAVLGCITREGVVARGPRRAGELQTAHFQGGSATLSQSNGQTLSLDLYHRYIVREAEGDRGPWTASTIEYVYDVRDQNGDKLAAWHWHPSVVRGDDRATVPHIHAYGTRDTLTLHKLHLPTGRVSIEAIVRFLIEDLAVVPRREDWRAILDRHEDVFHQTRTWA
jgi:hypothetical protein